MKILLDNKKNFYKANLHCHSTFSDGKLTVEEIKQQYKAKGYSIVAFTDHEHLIDNSHLDDDDFLSITSCEIAIKEFANQSTLKNYNMKVCHLNFYALEQHNNVTPCYSSVYDHYVNDSNRELISFEKEYDRKYSTDEINKIIKIANDSGFIVSYNHPSWSLENANDYIGYEGLFAVEIVNGGCVNAGHNVDENVFDDLLRAGKHIYCTAADDNHNTHGIAVPVGDSFGGWVCINADKLDYSTIMKSLQKGDFYASSGPEIKFLSLDDNTVEMQTSPCNKIVFVTRGRRVASVKSEIECGASDKLTSAKFELRELDEYFRIRVETADGKAAYTQCYSIK